jgi:hypothetical protein
MEYDARKNQEHCQDSVEGGAGLSRLSDEHGYQEQQEQKGDVYPNRDAEDFRDLK